MFKVGEYIVHPGQGVCQVVEVGDGPSAAYKLLPVSRRHALEISFPVSGESRLRPVVSADDAKALSIITIILQQTTTKVEALLLKRSILKT